MPKKRNSRQTSNQRSLAHLNKFFVYFEYVHVIYGVLLAALILAAVLISIYTTRINNFDTLDILVMFIAAGGFIASGLYFINFWSKADISDYNMAAKIAKYRSHKAKTYRFFQGIGFILVLCFFVTIMFGQNIVLAHGQFSYLLLLVLIVILLIPGAVFEVEHHRHW